MVSRPPGRRRPDVAAGVFANAEVAPTKAGRRYPKAMKPSPPSVAPRLGRMPSDCASDADSTIHEYTNHRGGGNDAPPVQALFRKKFTVPAKDARADAARVSTPARLRRATSDGLPSGHSTLRRHGRHGLAGLQPWGGQEAFIFGPLCAQDRMRSPSMARRRGPCRRGATPVGSGSTAAACGTGARWGLDSVLAGSSPLGPGPSGAATGGERRRTRAPAGRGNPATALGPTQNRIVRPMTGP